MSALPDLGAAFDRAKYDGYIFDCDGTLADSMPLHYQAWMESLSSKLGRPATEFTEELYYSYGGMPARHIVARMNQDYGWNLPAEQTAQDKERDFIKLIPGVGPVPEVVAVLESLGKSAKVVVASGGLTGIVVDTLKNIGVEVGPDQIVKKVIGSDQIKRGKPDPDLFLHAAEVLGVPPARCLVFEDAEPGFAAARAAGMDYMDVRKYRGNLSEAAR